MFSRLFPPHRTTPTPSPLRTFRPTVEALEDRVTPAALLPGFQETLIAGGLASPTTMDFAPDGRLFIAEKGGDLRVVKDGALLATPFVSLSVNSLGERGLLGVAFDPNFTVNHFVYVYYTVSTSPVHNRISRFTADGDVAVPGSEHVLMDLDNLNATNHNGGAIHFGPDGKLYVGVGENAVGANAQTLSNRLGKILRLNPDGSIPTDNPFYNVATGPNRAIWALGLRNPFSFAFQPGTGRMFINDVGENTWEEIDEGVAGGNYGWPQHEGPANPPDPSTLDPFYAYIHDGTVSAITSGAFYNPVIDRFPSDYVGDYFFSDLSGDFIKRLDPATRAVSTLATGIDGPVDLVVSADGSLYYLAINSGQAFRIQYVGLNPALRDTVGGFDPWTATWYQRNDNSPGAPTNPPFAYGGFAWVPVAGDWDGDHQSSVGVFDPRTATWYLRNNNTPGAPSIPAFAYGLPGWIPVVGDWDGNGTTTIGVVNPATMTWYLRNENGPGAPDLVIQFGAPGAVPLAGDWAGAGRTGIGAFDPFTASFYLRNTPTAGAPDYPVFRFGSPGWVPVAGDWDGDAKAGVGVFDPTTATWYLRNTLTAGAPDITPFAYGGRFWRPVTGQWAPAETLRAAGGPPPDRSQARRLQPADLDAVLTAALDRAAAEGIPPLPGPVRVAIRELGGDYLALALPQEGTILIDDDAAGYGWFVDATPYTDEEFSGGVALAGSAAAGEMDLLTVVEHELGHLAGLADQSAAAPGNELMAGTLPAGVRRL